MPSTVKMRSRTIIIMIIYYIMNKYREKHIDLDNLLTLNFNRATVPLVDSGENFLDLGSMEKSNICTILPEQPFFGTKFYYKKEWSYLDESKFKYKKYHTITINMDPSKLNYRNSLAHQKTLLFDIILKYQSKIRYLALVNEYGRGKLHFHMLLNIQSVKELEEDLKKEFGKERAVCVKKVIENNNETLESNLRRILQYFRKEEHNKHYCLLSKI